MSLFQKTVELKYLKQLDDKLLETQYNRFRSHFGNPEIQENIRNSKEEQYQGEFLIDLFVNVLGYTKHPSPNFNLTTEYRNIKDAKKADGAVIINDQVKAVIELKGTDTTDLGKVESQAFGYKNNQPDCTYVVISNFEKLRFYIDNAIEYQEFNLFTLTRAEFGLLYLCLAFESVSKDIPKRIKAESLSQEDKITRQLYSDYSLFKRALFHDLTELNKEFDNIVLFKKSQKLLDRFLFLLFAEDRQLLPPNSVRLILSDWRDLRERDVEIPLYDRFKKYFEYLNTGYKGKRYDVFAYNGGLFKADEILDNVKIDDELLYKHVLKLSEYDFASEVDVNILGHIFENSLNELDELKARQEGVEIDKSKTKRKKDGVFYTPKYITKYIVENTVGRLCSEKKAELQIVEEEFNTDKRRNVKTKKALLDKLNEYRDWLLQLTICDPACGSGAFLNQALDFLIKEHRYIDELQAKVYGASLIMSDFEKSILENNLFGVDLNEESVEIAKLSLWLRTAQPNRKLNDLNNNIKCGNSLIDDPAVAGDKAFNWQKEFPQVFEKGGFDVVIGNPPYVDIKALPKNIVKSLFENYKTAENRINLYSLFIEKGYCLVRNHGVLSYINPNSMLMNSSYSKLRRLIFDDLYKIIKLPDNVFLEAIVETIIFEVKKNENKGSVYTLKYSSSETISFIDDRLLISVHKKEWQKSSDLNFNVYSDLNNTGILTKVEQNCILLEEIADFTLGITPYDKYKGHSEDTIKNRLFHSKIRVDDTFKPLITGENITRYFTIPVYKEYIKYGPWLGAMREQRFFKEPRVLVRQIVSGNPARIFASFTDQEYYFTQIGFGIIPKNDSINVKYLLALLNSNLINYYHKFKFLDIEKNLFQKILIANCKRFPVKKISLSEQQAIHNKVDVILDFNGILFNLSQKFQRTIQRQFNLEELPSRLQEWYKLTFKEFIAELGKKKIKLSLSQQAEWEDYFMQEAAKALGIQARITTTDKEIDQMVYKLYELTEEEIEIVEKG